MTIYVFEVQDSDGYDSTQQITAGTVGHARKLACIRHCKRAHPYDSDAWPYTWASLVYASDQTEENAVCHGQFGDGRDDPYS